MTAVALCLDSTGLHAPDLSDDQVQHLIELAYRLAVFTQDELVEHSGITPAQFEHVLSKDELLESVDLEQAAKPRYRLKDKVERDLRRHILAELREIREARSLRVTPFDVADSLVAAVRDGTICGDRAVMEARSRIEIYLNACGRRGDREITKHPSV
jgi:hypothetical protein